MSIKTKKKRVSYKSHIDDDKCDEIRFVTIKGDPILRLILRYRYKTSGLSGDEWRISSWWQIPSEDGWADLDGPNGKIEWEVQRIYSKLFTSHPAMHEIQTRSIDFYYKGHKVYEATYNGKPLPLLPAAGHLPIAYMEADCRKRQTFDKEYCFQPGCSEKAVSTYKLIKEWCARCGKSRDPIFEYHRRFCLKHLRRGDCALEDADNNYIVIDGPGPDQAQGWEQHERPSAFGGYIKL